MKDRVLALCLLRAGCSEGLSPTTFATDIKPLLAYRMAPGEVRQAEKEARDHLVKWGFLIKPRRARTKLVLSDVGRREAARVVGRKAWPSRDPSWAKLVL